jgi:hypothetical protein
MKNTLEIIKTYAGGVTSLLLTLIGNLQEVVTGFVGQGASLAGVITLLLIVALFQKSTSSDK